MADRLLMAITLISKLFRPFIRFYYHLKYRRADTIGDFGQGPDSIGLTGGLTFSSLTFSGNEIRYGSEVLAILDGVNTSTLTAANLINL